MASGTWARREGLVADVVRYAFIQPTRNEGTVFCFQLWISISLVKIADAWTRQNGQVIRCPLQFVVIFVVLQDIPTASAGFTRTSNLLFYSLHFRTSRKSRTEAKSDRMTDSMSPPVAMTILLCILTKRIERRIFVKYGADMKQQDDSP